MLGLLPGASAKAGFAKSIDGRTYSGRLRARVAGRNGSRITKYGKTTAPEVLGKGDRHPDRSGDGTRFLEVTGPQYPAGTTFEFNYSRSRKLLVHLRAVEGCERCGSGAW
jgi:hypothetical protein